ncbi:SubName: Full=Related to iron transport protein {ECO:0000313/EMBL:CCA77931.1} [Serendipita indica DSM 11827]|uniref:Related to iron transport protein n=1 Tax=Serendipita indica (strain DSM 11827) TaxID=1109443 RepID=G4U334_SERID|nr:SubName: Full=Related to iron transport protein {ECO:0000313/EMBL:CCA77931.1} [Serendipita indica DSM 11827]CCA77931.1 related to iron transport protein [Serendipita indica DSM 11827]
MALPRLGAHLRLVSQTSQATRLLPTLRMSARGLRMPPRRFAVSLAAEPLSSETHAVRVRAPTVKDLQDLDLDPEALPQTDEAALDITPRAAEQLRSISMRENDKDIALRVSVESGGCHGYQYKMELTSKQEPDDYVFRHPSLMPSNVVIDAVSMGLLKGATLDFATELIGSSFRVVDNPQAKGSGCGCGVSWEAKD